MRASVAALVLRRGDTADALRPPRLLDTVPRMNRAAWILLGFPLAAVVAIGVVVAVTSGFHGVVIYAFFASVAIAVVVLVAYGSGGIEELSRSRFRDRPGSR